MIIVCESTRDFRGPIARNYPAVSMNHASFKMLRAANSSQPKGALQSLEQIQTWKTSVLVVDGACSAALNIGINSSSVSGSGLACILLAFADFSATPGRSASVTPHARSVGILSSGESALTQSMPSSTLASLRPVSRRAMAEWRSRAGCAVLGRALQPH